MKSLREQFEEDYAAIPVKKQSGKYKIRYVYDAPWYVWESSQDQVKQVRQKICIASIGSFLILCLCGCLASGINTEALAVIPMVCSLGLYVIEFFGVLQFCFSGDKTERITYNHIYRTLHIIPVLRSVCLVGAAGASVWLLVKNGGEIQDMIVLAGNITGIAGAVFTWKEFQKISVRLGKNHTVEG